MKINQEFFDFIEPALKEIKEQTNDDYMIFGSIIMYLLGILKFDKNGFFHDIDVMVKEESSIPEGAVMIYFQGNKEWRLYKKFMAGFEVDFGGIWPDTDTEDFFKRALNETEEINGYKFKR